MDDREWERARRLNLLDTWTTRLAWAIAVAAALGALVAGIRGHLFQALAGAGLAALAVLVARWVPSLIKIEEGD